MANEKDLCETQHFHERVDMPSILLNLLLSISSWFSMAREVDDDGIELFFKKTFLITPGILSSSGPVDEEDCFPSF